MSKFKPVIKWSGSKRSQSDEILKYFPNEIGTYFEPFVGGGSIVRALIESGIKTNRMVCSDLNGDLINLWNLIKDNPVSIAEHYAALWHKMNSTDDKTYKRDFFNKIRQRYNEERDPKDFMFIMRTTTNGMPRYNSNGDFNNSFHITRDGIKPETLSEIIADWSNVLNEKNVEFRCMDYRKILLETFQLSKNDFVYLDPPYANTKGMYFDNFNTDELYETLRMLKAPYLMSYDGISGNTDNTAQVPKDLYDEHLYIKSGNSSFKRTTGKSKDSIVFESLYIKHKL